MQIATLYEVTARQVVFEGNYITRYVFQAPNASLLPNGDVISGTDGKKIPIPVHQIRAIEGGSRYIAVDPELDMMLSAPYVEKLRAADARIDSLRSMVITTERTVREQLIRIEDFRKLPWPLRVWRALRREL